MKFGRAFLSLIGAAVAVGAMPAAAQDGRSESCADGEVGLHLDFEGAGGRDCERTDTGFAITIAPETTPINRSPWYAFDITAEQPATVEVELRYTYGEHRYVPKIEVRDTSRAEMEPSVSTEDLGERAILTLTLPAGRFRVSAQPVIPSPDRVAWARGFAEASDFSFHIAGASREGRNIVRLTSDVSDSPLIVLLLGGQHPPEVSGSLAMRAFLERIAEDGALANRFRARFRIDAFPLLNPDGIAAGHWRTTAGLEDLNRDWGIYSQIESHAVGSFVYDRWQAGERPVLMVDFHATRVGDVLYVPQPDAPGVEPFLSNWIARVDARMGDEPGFEPITGNNPGLPTARSWFTRTFHRPGVTLEIGDETDLARTQRLARAAAEAMMAQLLEDFPPAETD
ncbi:M14 family zinc carboxypeptidase [Aurantiacibacter sp. MUD61]|uniref:M14 family zinc carboxypeptidase n=1 Tax=Aurantiacibacter sp. MUD61 TaxID=3009083 RepID=UPI0022F1176C|nr:M14 family zinc carboxypeptidase [Aurantiacibacter sp. MUD61]